MYVICVRWFRPVRRRRTGETVPDRLVPGRVSSIAQEAEYTPRSVQTKDERVDLMFAITVDVDNPTGSLLIGMPVDARFP